MIMCVCIDDERGMSFFGKRVTHDRVQIGRLLEHSKGKRIYTSEYSYALFAPHDPDNVRVTADFCEAEAEDICFFELEHITEHVSHADAILIYRWNRRYPSDKKFPFHPADKGYRLVSSVDFAGSSHEKITEELWQKG